MSKKTDSVTAQELELIGRFARKKLSGDELYTFTLILCDNEIDRDFECFSKESLNKLKELYPDAKIVGITPLWRKDLNQQKSLTFD